MQLIRRLVREWRRFTRPRLRLRNVDEEPETPTRGVLYVVGSRELQKWAVFSCPCGCRDRITLYLGDQRRPSWKIHFDRAGVTLTPSVWQTRGCGAHFFVRDGRVDFV